jgi:hypothetical protein
MVYILAVHLERSSFPKLNLERLVSFFMPKTNWSSPRKLEEEEASKADDDQHRTNGLSHVISLEHGGDLRAGSENLNSGISGVSA